ncbi:LytTR family DNA-binding domain-containing protein [Roseivirga sp. E12]|uniref:LytR/AlgR family response regulator transcription factor n=1 Tax=Roseivirga sp. E12 TaxID=2819237 RepID=UPI001ABC4373|nr:LytTR family DNA-binding domain-containing protein [Roseivirga sp. E12]MBO3700321.1 LytTR family transcriptional regulator [Roseivirga sp. E12]
MSFFCWTIIAIIFTTKTDFYYELQDISTSWIHLSIHHLATAWTWVLLTPVLYFIYRKVFGSRHSLIFKGTSLLVLAIILGSFHRATALTLDAAFRKYMGYIDGSIIDNVVKMDSVLVPGMFDSALTFVIMLAAFYLLDQVSKARTRDQKPKYETKQKEDRLMVKHDGVYAFINPSDLIAVTAAGNYVKLQLSNEKPILIRETITSFTKNLVGQEFVRLNRSTIVNLSKVQSFKHKVNGDYTLILIDGSDFTTSKRYGDSWKRVLSQ